MILIDTGALLGLMDRRDRRHQDAVECYDDHASEDFVLTLPILTETCWLLEARVGGQPPRLLVEDVLAGSYRLLALDLSHLQRAVEIDEQYSDAAFGFADSCSLAIMESLEINTVFTFDRRDFEIYRSPRGRRLKIIP